MRVRVPQIPTFDSARSELERLTTSLGYPALAGVDLEGGVRAGSLVEEFAVVARRGWLCELDGASDVDVDEEFYVQRIDELLMRAGVVNRRLELRAEELVVWAEDVRVAVPRSYLETDGDGVDAELVATVVAEILAPLGIVTAIANDEGAVLVAVMPQAVWLLMLERGWTGEFSEVLVQGEDPHPAAYLHSN